MIQAALKARHLTEESLRERLGMPQSEFQRKLHASPHPAPGFLSKVARELSLPEFSFFLTKTPDIADPLVDFRSEQPVRSAKARKTTDSILVAEALQKFLKRSDVNWNFSFNFFQKDINPIDLAADCRKKLSFDNATQIKAENVFTLYNILRNKIENCGIFVLHFSFPPEDGSGFCLADENFPVIGINTNQQTRARQLFTLAHEFCHAVLGVSGISDPFKFKNSEDTERYCNQFAKNFLLPESYVRQVVKPYLPIPSGNFDLIPTISNKLKASQQATVLRLEDLGLIRSGTYGRWLKMIKSSGNPDFQKSRGGRPRTQEVVKLSKYGYRFAHVFADLLERDKVTELEIFRLVGLKPKYARRYFKYANSLSELDIESLVLQEEDEE